MNAFKRDQWFCLCTCYVQCSAHSGREDHQTKQTDQNAKIAQTKDRHMIPLSELTESLEKIFGSASFCQWLLMSDGTID